MKKTLILLAGITLTAGLSAQAQSTLADWTFETSLPSGTGQNSGSYNPESGIESATATATGSHASASTAYSSPAGNGSAHSFSANNWGTGDYYQIELSTTGYSSIMLTFDQTSSSTGPGTFQLEYSTDGTHFSTIGSAYAVLPNGTSPNAAWSTATYVAAYTFGAMNLSTLTSEAVDNEGQLYIRFVDLGGASASGGTLGTAGTDRLDNIDVTGVALVPEPSSVALLGIGGMAFLAKLRRNKK